MCPACQSDNHLIKKGFYTRRSDRKRIQRYFCLKCQRRFSDQTHRIDYRHRKRYINQQVFRLLCKGVSQRSCALIVGVQPPAIAIRIERFAAVAEKNLKITNSKAKKSQTILIDEMESFEHTKCKPLTIPIAVEDKTRRILALDVGKIAAKGHLAVISRKKYGHRKCERERVLNNVFKEITKYCEDDVVIKSDLSRHYPAKIKKFFPRATHLGFKGRRGAVVGQGELKRGGFDPLFSLNHTYAMIRDNLKRLTRKTWCTTKRPNNLIKLIYIYSWFHNLRLINPKRPRLVALV
jgi:transposase-like protein